MIKFYNAVNIFLTRHRSLILAILYILSPIDLIPELFFGLFGLIDDTVVFILIIAYLSVNWLLYSSKVKKSYRTNTNSKVDFEYEDAEFEEIK
jgi:uncharacterized membrane protein YkvA (DUF1232 family)